MPSRHFVNVYESSIIRLVFFLLLCVEIEMLDTGMRILPSVVSCIYAHSVCEATLVLEPV